MKKGIVVGLSFLGGAVVAAAGMGKALVGRVDDKSKMSEKHFALYMLMNQWVKIKQENKSIAEYLEKNGYRQIAIYGMSYAGETLMGELAGSNINVKYGIDKNADRIYQDIDVLTPDDDLPEVDAVIVTAITFFDEIKENLNQKLDCDILSMEDILHVI